MDARLKLAQARDSATVAAQGHHNSFVAVAREWVRREHDLRVALDEREKEIWLAKYTATKGPFAGLVVVTDAETGKLRPLNPVELAQVVEDWSRWARVAEERWRQNLDLLDRFDAAMQAYYGSMAAAADVEEEVVAAEREARAFAEDAARLTVSAFTAGLGGVGVGLAN